MYESAVNYNVEDFPKVAVDAYPTVVIGVKFVSTKVETNLTPVTTVGYASTATLGKSSALSLTADLYICSVKTMY